MQVTLPYLIERVNQEYLPSDDLQADAWIYAQNEIEVLYPNLKIELRNDDLTIADPELYEEVCEAFSELYEDHIINNQ